MERLESRQLLTVDPVLTVAGDQMVDEGALLSISDLGAFTDQVVAGGVSSVGLNAADFTSLGAFDPLSAVVIDTDSLSVTGGFTGTGTTVTADTGAGPYEIAVFTFDSFQLDAGVTLTATGSRPMALLSNANLDVAGVIDVSAAGLLAGVGGGRGGFFDISDLTLLNGAPAAGAPATPTGVAANHGFGRGQTFSRGGGGGAFGGNGGEGFGFLASDHGDSYGDLTLGIQGGSGGGAGHLSSVSTSGFFDGGSGGGGVELGAVGAVTISGSVLADGSDASLGSKFGGAGGGAGGGILLHGFDVTVSGTLSAKGGDVLRGAGPFPAGLDGGAGGGGRILLAHDNLGLLNTTGSTITAAAGVVPVEAAGLGTEAADGVFSVVAVAPTPVLETYDFVINWGDGSATDVGVPDVDIVGTPGGADNQGSFDGSHTYADNGLFTVTATVNDSGGGTDTQVFLVTVNNVAPVVAAPVLDFSIIDEGDAVALTATFTDVGVLDTHTAVIDWGDGTVEAGVVDQLTGTVAGGHAYADDGAYTVTVSVTDDDGGLGSGQALVAVNNVAPVITSLATDSPAIGGAGEGDLVSLTAAFTDVGVLDTHMATIDWGDGTTSTGTVDQLTGTVAGSHVYTSGGIFDVTLSVVDDDSGVAVDTVTSVIAGVGVNNGVLQVVGTNLNDRVKVFRAWGGDLIVISRIGGAPVVWETITGATKIEMFLGGGRDFGMVSSSVSLDAKLDGGDGNDLLIGGSGNDVVLGGAGYDILLGRGGRDLLIGGTGSDLIIGMGGEDILISGTTAFDNNAAALDAIMAEWTSSRDYATRVGNVTGTGFGLDFDSRLNGNIFLNETTVFDDEAADWLIGGGGLDLYFANLSGGVQDHIFGLRNDETFVESLEV